MRDRGTVLRLAGQYFQGFSHSVNNDDELLFFDDAFKCKRRERELKDNMVSLKIKSLVILKAGIKMKLNLV